MVATHRDRVLEFLARCPGRDDDEIASALEIEPRQTINILCRKLHREGLLRRELGSRGKIVNFLTDKAVETAPMPVILAITPGSQSAPLSEDQVKAELAKWLEMAGWSVKVAWGRTRGIDIVASRGTEKWIIECKGIGSSAPMKNNYFLGVVGEVLQRMHDDGARHSVAFPDLPKFRRLWKELPSRVKEQLKLTALFVTPQGTVSELN